MRLDEAYQRASIAIPQLTTPSALQRAIQWIGMRGTAETDACIGRNGGFIKCCSDPVIGFQE